MKEELSVIEETREYMNHAVERARKIMRRMDNQYRAVVKSAQAASDPKRVIIDEPDSELEHLLEGFTEDE